MTGVFIEVDAQSFARAERYLQRIITAGQSLEPAFAEIGEYLLESHAERFSLEVAPDGTPWEPLAPATLANKADDRILQEEGFLRDTLAYQVTGAELLFGTNRIYGATHQFGREEDGIPARPYLGIATSPWNDEDEIVAILKDHLQS